MVSSQYCLNLMVTLSIACSVITLIHSDEIADDIPSPNRDPYFNSFITARMKHLAAINDVKHLKNSVKRHQLVLDLSKELFKVLDQSRKLLAEKNPVIEEGFSALDKKLQTSIIEYMENTAFFSDLLVFFPDITLPLLEKNLLWRITLIDSIQRVISFNAKFVDENTHTQFEKAYQILSEGIVTPEPKLEKKVKEGRKLKRKPRMAQDEL